MIHASFDMYVYKDCNRITPHPVNLPPQSWLKSQCWQEKWVWRSVDKFFKQTLNSACALNTTCCKTCSWLLISSHPLSNSVLDWYSVLLRCVVESDNWSLSSSCHLRKWEQRCLVAYLMRLRSELCEVRQSSSTSQLNCLWPDTSRIVQCQCLKSQRLYLMWSNFLILWKWCCSVILWALSWPHQSHFCVVLIRLKWCCFTYSWDHLSDMTSQFSLSDKSEWECDLIILWNWNWLKTWQCIVDFDQAGNLLMMLSLHVSLNKTVERSSVIWQRKKVSQML